MKTRHITDIEKEPIERISFFTIPQKSIEPSEYSLPIYKGKIKGLSENINVYFDKRIKTTANKGLPN